MSSLCHYSPKMWFDLPVCDVCDQVIEGPNVQDEDNHFHPKCYYLSDEETCPICFDELMNGKLLTSLPCHPGHIFHHHCTIRLLSSTPTPACPTCRAPITAEAVIGPTRDKKRRRGPPVPVRRQPPLPDRRGPARVRELRRRYPEDTALEDVPPDLLTGMSICSFYYPFLYYSDKK